MSKRFRQYLFCILAGITYLIIHEGTHVLQAVYHSVFAGFRFNGLGIEVLITQPLAIGGWKLACFSGLSSMVTVFIGYVIFSLTPLILSFNNRFLKSYLYYVTFVFLLLDPLYISIFSFFVGGDINGIAIGLEIPYMIVRVVFFIVLALNTLFVVKKLYPKYTEDYRKGI